MRTHLITEKKQTYFTETIKQKLLVLVLQLTTEQACHLCTVYTHCAQSSYWPKCAKTELWCKSTITEYYFPLTRIGQKLYGTVIKPTGLYSLPNPTKQSLLRRLQSPGWSRNLPSCIEPSDWLLCTTELITRSYPEQTKSNTHLHTHFTSIILILPQMPGSSK